eukprot:1154269-Pelagomonas_calceolata.AAC.1
MAFWQPVNLHGRCRCWVTLGFQSRLPRAAAVVSTNHALQRQLCRGRSSCASLPVAPPPPSCAPAAAAALEHLAPAGAAAALAAAAAALAAAVADAAAATSVPVRTPARAAGLALSVADAAPDTLALCASSVALQCLIWDARHHMCPHPP